MQTKRLRVFAGPNGSGKTTIIKNLYSKINFGIYVNADDIESNLKLNNKINFDEFKLNITENQIQFFFQKSKFAPVKRNDTGLYKKFIVKNNILELNTQIDSYLAADIAEFIRQELLKNNLSFTYETVMSHENKIDFLEKARRNNYRVYLYYIATEDPIINISRVNIRVAQNGHSVAPEVITKRYFKSLGLLKSAVKISNRAFIWDNSNEASILIAEITNGENIQLIDKDKIPNWFSEYLLK